jgi:hypothetical protein
MCGYADPACFFPVKFQAAPVNRNDTDVIRNCFVNAICTAFIGRMGLANETGRFQSMTKIDT